MRQFSAPLGVFAACLLAGHAACAQQVAITDAWVHATPPFGTVAPAYLTLRSAANDTLTGISINSGGTATLEKAVPGKDKSTLALPAGKPVTLGPGGNFIALVGDRAPLIPGSRVGMTLYFKHAAPETVELNVLSTGGPYVQAED